MAKFSVRRVHFGQKPGDDFDDDGTGLPTPIKIKNAARRMAGIKEAKAVLDLIPAAGESLHAVCTSRMDQTDVIAAMLDKLGPASTMRIATLGYNEKNLRAMLGWLDTGRVKSLTLLASIFFRSHKGALWAETLKEFRTRGQRAACCHSHAKVVAIQFEHGAAMSIEGSANLCGNGSGREQFALMNDAALEVWHRAWIEELVNKHEEGRETTAGRPQG